MNMIATIRSADAWDSIFCRLDALIAGRPASPDAARLEARQLISMAIADTWQADSLWGAIDAFHAHFDFMMQTVEINGTEDPGLRTLRTKCRFYLEQVEALCRSLS
ncbi:hypothetical protein EN829_005235 [Mesorhizobium sp. M00.F.Ca.ET.186.01.1.1]|nr:hypothetical protein EN848_03430 [bacterium M00.F.Ca.ET.205.01.1.1]TGU54881.1 hypothetical protein EN795_07845 [bacterium M00.F.Ca.ET.152.01.1.1]TGV38347.1 hypothetical protein EN829_005235 [Mesorhizobium sp. M00.F.Ca.ET.186.01.1.1]TGZ44453.1 hypothetical protein EN805_07850 [bacterium M00.F.Ca.ET.162.01.1.1]TIW62397.1 MAG: hypothetical protein E5V48_05225 [Mesorhizobium sp.]